MESRSPIQSVPPGGDLLFQCQHCDTSLVVDDSAAGMIVLCEECGKPTTVPSPALGAGESPAAVVLPVAGRLEELRRHLKENESQRLEVKGYINQLSIQLHRWQLRLQTLEERHRELSGEIAQLEGEGSPVSLG